MYGDSSLAAGIGAGAASCGCSSKGEGGLGQTILLGVATGIGIYIGSRLVDRLFFGR